MGLTLADRVAIVTGAAQGIGEATARTLAARGAAVVGIDILGERLAQVMGGLPGGLAMPFDVTDAEAGPAGGGGGAATLRTHRYPGERGGRHPGGSGRSRQAQPAGLARCST